MDAAAKWRISQNRTSESDKTEAGAAGVGLRIQEEDRGRAFRDRKI